MLLMSVEADRVFNRAIVSASPVAQRDGCLAVWVKQDGRSSDNTSFYEKSTVGKRSESGQVLDVEASGLEKARAEAAQTRASLARLTARLSG